MTLERYSEALQRERFTTAYGLNSKEINFYELLQGQKDSKEDPSLEKHFPSHSGGQIFTTAVLLGFLYNKQSDKHPNDQFLRFSSVSDTAHANILKMIFLEICDLPANKTKTSHEVFLEFCKYADGGIEILYENYVKNNNKLNIAEIYDEVIKGDEENGIDSKIAEKSAAILNVLNAGN